MSQEIREQLSALMDGELSRDETGFLMRRVAHDQGLVSCWSNFHLVRLALRRQVIVGIRPGFTESVLAQIEAEAQPEVMRSGSWMRWASGGAIAASVAVAALVLSGPKEASKGMPGEPIVSSTSIPTTASPATLSVAPAATRNTNFLPPMAAPILDVQPASASTAGFTSQPMPIDPRTQSYLVRHYDATGSNGQPGMLPYVLLIVPSAQQATVVPVEQAAEQH